MVVGHGIDIVEIPLIEQRLEAGDEWVVGAFTEAEQAEADPPPNRAQYFAGRYAVKEAVAKALGTGFTDEVVCLDVEVLRLPSGAPYATLTEGALAVAELLGITAWFVSIGHRGSYVIGSAIAVREPI
ncbi:MAG: holo-ACP synthase [Gemmataceae bacterium]